MTSAPRVRDADVRVRRTKKYGEENREGLVKKREYGVKNREYKIKSSCTSPSVPVLERQRLYLSLSVSART